jgi:hypothetical protein
MSNRIYKNKNHRKMLMTKIQVFKAAAKETL